MTHETPVLKWVGGKRKLLPVLITHLPAWVHTQEFCWVEPFFGGGAFGLWALNHLPYIKEMVINDINADLMGFYCAIKRSPYDLIDEVQKLQKSYNDCITLEDKKPFFYAKRKLYNERISDPIAQAALFLFLNKTSFNGLYRVNKKNEFNVPIGSYKKPILSTPEDILNLSYKLQNVRILVGEYRKTLLCSLLNLPTFFYLDPPYRPISRTSSFTTYSKEGFDDAHQKHLADFCQKIHDEGHAFMQSNANTQDGFFEHLYADFNIHYINAPRSMGIQYVQKGQAQEILICNF